MSNSKSRENACGKRPVKKYMKSKIEIFFFFFFFFFFYLSNKIFFFFFFFFPIHINTIKNIQLNNKYQHLSYYLPSFLIYMFIMRYKICTGFFVKPGNKREGVGSVCEGGRRWGGWRRGVLPSTEKKQNNNN